MDYLVTDFGAIGNGMHLDTRSIQAAIDKAAAAGGGRVILPTGMVFLSGSLVLKQAVVLHLEPGAVLQASSNYADYPPTLIRDLTGGEVDETVLPQRAFISAFRAHDMKITGSGEINGAADGFIEVRGEYIHQMRAPQGGKSQYLERPFTIFLIESNNVELLDFTIKDPAFWALRTTGCNDLLIDGITIETDLMVPNADGIDIDRCQRVLIQNCKLATADDCISLKSCAATAKYGDVREVVIRNCFMISTSGAITLGTESVGDIRDVLVTDCVVSRSHRGFAVRAREGGLIENVRFQNSSVETRTFSPEWWGHGEALHVTAFAWNLPENLQDGNVERLLPGRVKNITFENLDVKTEAGILNWSQELGLIDGVSYREVRTEIGRYSKWPSRIDLRPNDLLPILERSHNAFEVVNCKKVLIENCSVSWLPSSRSEYLEAIGASGSVELVLRNLVEAESDLD